MTIGIVVIEAGMVDRTHAAAYRVVPTLYELALLDLRYISTGDMNTEVEREATRHCGYERSNVDWWVIADGLDTQVVSVITVNGLYLGVVRGPIEAGEYVLCEKLLSNTLVSAQKMADLAREVLPVVRIGLTYRR